MNVPTGQYCPPSIGMLAAFNWNPWPGSSESADEINRRSKPLGVKIQEGEFSTPQAAKQAGEAALRELLRELTGENSRPLVSRLNIPPEDLMQLLQRKNTNQARGDVGNVAGVP
jgi:hypothetical protein